MLIGYHAGGLDEPDIERAAEVLCEAGYEGVQLAGPVVKTIVEQDAWERAGQTFAARGLRVLMSWGPSPSIDELASGDEAAGGYAKWRAEAEKVRRAGCEALMLMPQGARGPAPQTLASAGRHFASYARTLYGDTGVRASIHQHFNSPLETWEDLAVFAEAIDGEASALIADAAHLTKGGIDPARFVRVFASKIDMLHIKDVDAAGRFVFPGQGVVDFAAVFEAAAASGLDGSVVADLHDAVYDGNRVIGGRAWLSRFLAPAQQDARLIE